MNQDTLKGEWLQLKGRVRKEWGQADERRHGRDQRRP